MGNLEKQSAIRTKKDNIQKAILYTIASAGLISVAVLAPNVLCYLGKEIKYFTARSNRSLKRLLDAKLVVFVEKDGGKYVRLTPKGEKVFAQWEAQGYYLKKPKKWDKKWRILSFDIWEKRRDVRDKLRLVLKRVGFYQMQRSVWVYPYDCEDMVQLLKADFKVGKGMLYVIADQVENEKALKEYFNLGD